MVPRYIRPACCSTCLDVSGNVSGYDVLKIGTFENVELTDLKAVTSSHHEHHQGLPVLTKSGLTRKAIDCEVRRI
jgi:hypothetical protein